MGGHAGAFINVERYGKSGCKILCGKKLSGDTVKEFTFYRELNDLVKKNMIASPAQFKKNIPVVEIAACERDGVEYIVMENIKSNVGSNSRVLDWKVGFKTAAAFDVGKMKNERHRYIDGTMSSSKTQGFRLEGVTKGRRELIKKKLDSKYKQVAQRHSQVSKLLPIGDKYKLYNLDPMIIYDHFFENDVNAASKIYQKMRLFYDRFITANYAIGMENQRKKTALSFYGSSVLFVVGDGGADFKLIDFAHPVMLYPDTKGKELQRYRKAIINYSVGFKKLMDSLELWVLMASV